MRHARSLWSLSCRLLVDQQWPHDASRRAGSAGVSVPLADFYVAKGRFLRPKARLAFSAATLPPSCRHVGCMETI